MRSNVLVVVAILVLALSVRLLGLGSFMTVDEENWMIRSSEFWHKLMQGDPGGTFITTHPGATLMWLAGAGEIIQEKRTGINVDTSTLSTFRKAATLPVALATSTLIAMATWLLVQYLPLRLAAIAGFFLALEPYLTGLSQVAHLDALLSLFMLNALLALFWYQKKYRYSALTLAGIFWGLAMATKLLPALYVGLFMMGMLTWQHMWSLKRTWRSYIAAAGFVCGMAVITLYGVWPALWVKADLNESFQHDVQTIITDEHILLEEDGELISPVTFYVKTVLSRTTPFILIIATVTGILSLIQSINRRSTSYSWWLMWYALGFLIMITLTAKKADRYGMPALVVLPLLATFGLSLAIQIFEKRWVLITGLVSILFVVHALVLSPYAIAYNSPFYNGQSYSQQGWGEGLDAAARWLNTHPLADRLTVASWYPGVTATYFKGKTMSLSSRQDDRVGFVVLYRNMFGRGGDSLATDVLEEFHDKTPEHIVYIQGRPYAWIYNTLGLRYFLKNAGEITDSVEVGQTVKPLHDTWSSIQIGMATFSGRLNTHDVILHIKESAEATDDLRTVTINAREIKDGAWQAFAFEPIPNAAGKAFFVVITSPSSVAGNAITVHYVDRDVLEGEMYLRGINRPGWDIAYKIP